MVKHSTNIIKTNNYFSLQINKHKKTMTYDNAYPDLSLGLQNCEGVKLFNGIQTLPS